MPLLPILDNFDDTIKQTTAGAVACGAVILMGDTVGVAIDAAAGSGVVITVRVRGRVNSQVKDPGSVWRAGDTIYWDNVNAWFTRSPTPYRAGQAADAQLITDTTGNVILAPFNAGRLYLTQAPSAVIASIAAETLFSLGYTIPANDLKNGDEIIIEAIGVVVAQNGADTNRIRLYLGGLAGTLLVDTAAVNAAAGAVFHLRAKLVVRTAGQTGTFVCAGEVAFGAPGTTMKTAAFVVSTAIDTTAAQAIAVSCAQSANNAGDQTRLEILTVRRAA